MKILLWFLAAACGYLVGGISPSIMLSVRKFGKDVRTCGSGNAGFTNFKRNFDGPYAWIVLLLDVCKAAVVTGLFAWLFGKYLGNAKLGAAYTGMFTAIGHAYPPYYKLKGGKCILVYLVTVFMVDWRVGLICAALLVALLLAVKLMSLSTLSAVLLSIVLLAFMSRAKWYVVLICAAISAFIFVRHKENIKRLLNGTESKFLLFKRMEKNR